MKTSQFPYAAALDGAELVGVVQEGNAGVYTVKTTANAVSAVSDQRPYVRIGLEADTYGFSSVAIGYESQGIGSTASTAIGTAALSAGFLSVSMNITYCPTDRSVCIGKYTAVLASVVVAFGCVNYILRSGEGSITLGYRNRGPYNNTISIGHKLDPGGANATVIGDVREAEASQYSTAIGNELYSYGPNNVLIGSNSLTGYSSIALGYASGSGMSQYTIAVGSNIVVYETGASGIGTSNRSGRHTTVVGRYNEADASGTAIGNYCYAPSAGIAIGQSAACLVATAIGTNVSTGGHYATVLGSQVTSQAIGALTVTGSPTSGLLRPVTIYQKFVGQTISAKKASAGWGNGSYLASVSYNTTGTVGNSFLLSVGNNIADAPLTTAFDGTTFSILLATNDPSTNTLANIAALFPTNGFIFTYTSGFGDSVVAFAFTANFVNGTDGNPTATLTADGESATDANSPTISAPGLATITGRVVGVASDLFNTGGDAATFTLAPVMVVKDDGSQYSFIGTPTFTMISDTGGTWEVPVLSTDSSLLSLTVTNDAADVLWAAHLTFEASQIND